MDIFLMGREIEQIGITGDDEGGFGGERASEDAIVIGVARDLWRVDPFGQLFRGRQFSGPLLRPTRSKFLSTL